MPPVESRRPKIELVQKRCAGPRTETVLAPTRRQDGDEEGSQTKETARMSKPNYRVILTYDPDRKVFLGRAPELEHCSGEGATRAEATARVEEEIDAQLANMLSHGTTPPRSVDEEVFSG